MEEDDSFSESEEELTEKSNREREVNGKQNKARDDKDQESSIRVEKVAGIYNIVINEASMKSLRNTWWECLIVKLLGRRISLAVLTRKLEALWSKMGSIDVIDIGNNFFIVRIAVWVRLPGLDIEYYDEDMLKRIGNIVGRTMRVDTHTVEKCKGHEKSNCAMLQKAAETYRITAATAAGVVEGRQEENQKSQSQERGNVVITENEKGKKVIQHDNDTYGPWMLVQRPTHGKKVGKMGASTSNAGGNALNAKDTAMTVPGTRFSILQQENDVLQNNPERLPNYVEKENIIILSQSQPSSRTRPNSSQKTTHPRDLPAQNQTSKQAQNASPAQNPKMRPQQTPPLCDILTQPNFAPTHNPVPNQTTSNPTMKHYDQDNDHVPTNPTLLNRSTPPHHYSVN
ncbi:hypothetical protein AHAS_Ahas13G0152300 [Arachis hypogaea]